MAILAACCVDNRSNIPYLEFEWDVERRVVRLILSYVGDASSSVPVPPVDEVCVEQRVDRRSLADPVRSCVCASASGASFDVATSYAVSLFVTRFALARFASVGVLERSQSSSEIQF